MPQDLTDMTEIDLQVAAVTL